MFDTDLGTDDAAVLLVSFIASEPAFDYIIASQGNTTLDGAVQNARVQKKVSD